MHEASLAERVLKISAEAAKGRRVASVTVVLGALSGVMPGALRFAFDAAKAGAGLPRAQLILQTQPVQAQCKDCGECYAPEAFPYRCPACGSPYFSITAGENFYVKELETQ